jgi:tetratricopeptide (TPR) repeat protein
MKQADGNKRREKLKVQVKSWIPVIIALPITGILLATIPPDLRAWVGSFAQPARTELNAPYRYRFARLAQESAIGSAALEQEIAFYQERIARNPKDGLDLAALASTYLQMARLTGISNWYLLAEQTAQRSLSNLPFNNHGATLVLARIAEAKHDFSETIRLAEQVLRSQPGNEDALALLVTTNLAIGKVQVANQIVDRLVNRIPTVGTLTLRASVKIAQGQDQAAIQDFQQALAVEEAGDASGSARIRTLLGRFYAQRGNHTLAAQLYQEALHILPHYPLALINLAELETRLGQYQAAEKHYAEVLAISQDSTAQVFDHLVWRGMARLKELQNDRAAANELQAKAETQLRQHLNLSSFGHRRELARLLLERGRSEDLGEALSLMQAEVRVRRDAQTFDTLAWAFARSKRWQEARQAMHSALRSGVRDAGMVYRAGLIEQGLGNFAQAQTFFQSAKEIDPTFDESARRAVGLGLDT